MFNTYHQEVATKELKPLLDPWEDTSTLSPPPDLVERPVPIEASPPLIAPMPSAAALLEPVHPATVAMDLLQEWLRLNVGATRALASQIGEAIGWLYWAESRT